MVSCGGGNAKSRTTIGRVPAEIALLGDSNFVVSAAYVSRALTTRPDPYVLTLVTRPGIGIRFPDCPKNVSCATNDWWKVHLAATRGRSSWDGIVVDLGINDTSTIGSQTSPGWANYGAKIDWLMRLLPAKPVWWTNLPCRIEPPTRQVGCAAVNKALAAAPARWSRLTVLDWAKVADEHREYLGTSGVDLVHLTESGSKAYAELIRRALDGRFSP